jgi:hypothetical protein
MNDTPEYDFLPKFVPCPVCKKLIVEDSVTCKYCNTQAGAHFARIKEVDAEREEQRREEQEQAERDRVRARWVMGIIAAGLFLWIASCISNANPPPKQYYNEYGSQSITPGAYTFQAHGKLKLEYSCFLNTGKAATVQLTLVDTKASKTVWSKSVKCTTSQETNLSEIIQVKSGTYDVGAKVTGDGDWNVKVTQA